LLLIALAVLPLAGTAWFAAREVGRTSEARAESERMAERTEEVVEATRLGSAILDERNWVLVARGIEEIGVPNALVTNITGIDPEDELRAARADVDRLAAAHGRSSITESIAAARIEPESMANAGDGFLEIEQELAVRNEAVLHELSVSAGDVSGGGDLVASLHILEYASEASESVSLQLVNYFATQFTGPGLYNADLGDLAAQQALHEQAMASLTDSVQIDTSTASVLASLQASAAAGVFLNEVSGLVETTTSAGSERAELTSEAVFADLDHVVGMFRSGTESAAMHFDLVEAAADDVIAASDEVRDATSGAATRAGWMFGVFAVASLAFAFALGGFILWPLRRLAERAGRLRDEDFVAGAPMRGPREVLQVAAAIDEATVHLDLAARQANALAEGQLDHPALSEPAPGALGSSLQLAVRTLARSLDESEEFQQRLEHQATHDGLTSLPNRTASLDMLGRGLARTRRNDSKLAVMFVDLDGFKGVNDSHGHLVGDSVLRAVARRLVDSVREGDHVGRLGGDEFLVIGEPITDVKGALAVARRIIALMSEPIVVGDIQVEIDASIGIAITDGSSDLTPDELLRDADVAVYKAKALGRGRIELCDEALKSEILGNEQLDRALRTALSDDEFTLHYQPTVDREDGSIVSVEALVRWQRPGHGLVAPGQFIPFAERSDLIIDIDKWVLRRAARQLHEWDGDAEMASVPISVNISARHFASNQLARNILGPLHELGIDPSRMMIELTESALLGDLHTAADKLLVLREAGIRVAIDDFGTGYTSLAYLRALPVDILKIDGSFIADATAESLIKLIIDTGHFLGVTITAEGVETEAQQDLLVRLGCDQLQGFHYARPQPPSDLVTSAPAAAEAIDHRS
jgi:diguanylate cyclase (GGDEF)-like protein